MTKVTLRAILGSIYSFVGNIVNTYGIALYATRDGDWAIWLDGKQTDLNTAYDLDWHTWTFTELHDGQIQLALDNDILTTFARRGGMFPITLGNDQADLGHGSKTEYESIVIDDFEDNFESLGTHWRRKGHGVVAVRDSMLICDSLTKGGTAWAVCSSIPVATLDSQRYYHEKRLATKYLESHGIRKLHLGSGERALEGWLNTDLNPPTREIMHLDATKTLPFENCSFDYVFMEHLIEHLTYEDGVRLVQECHRILKAGGKIRISTPDLRFLIELFNENKTELQKRYIAWAVDSFLPEIGIHQESFVINNLFRAWGHEFIYDYKTLYDVLLSCGFSNITRYSPGESDDENLRGIEQHGHAIGDEFNELESVVIEAIGGK